MTEVKLNDECMHCNNRECHDGEHFCNYAMKDNSFYKNAKLYKGLEVIQRPTYEELEKENAELRNNGFTVSAMTEQQLKVALEKGEQLEKENAELSEKLSEQKQYTTFKCNEFVKKKEVYEREHFLLTKAKDIIKKVAKMYRYSPRVDEIIEQAEQFLSEVEK